jgi:hypothetical protein
VISNARLSDGRFVFDELWRTIYDELGYYDDPECDGDIDRQTRRRVNGMLRGMDCATVGEFRERIRDECESWESREQTNFPPGSRDWSKSILEIVGKATSCSYW